LLIFVLPASSEPTGSSLSEKTPPQEPAPIVIVQLSGRGLVLVESERPLRALVVTAEHRVVVRSESVAGWTGRMLAQPLTAEESPTRAHGFVSFSGEGAVLLDDA